MVRSILSLAALATVALVAAGPLAPVLAKEPRRTMVLIPFENERATDRGDRALVSLNEDITRLPGFRVLELPVVDGRLGQHAKLDDVEIYFPFGTVVVATAEFNRYRPALVASGVTTPESMLDPRYDRVREFDRQLGRVCASEADYDGNTIEMRINAANKMMSVVHVLPAKFRGPDAAASPSYRVVSGLDMRFLKMKEPSADDLYRKCLHPGGTRLTQKN
ncbi:hypothetical protein [Ferrovibrio xuzhouensis]|uniref:Secreted protein n=1 Tax=Ferrovibrio xuzhouensis TaxID=1576914 RepID=A0ABV7VJE5_9PROT